MITKIFVVPADGLKVRNPAKLGWPIISEDGEWLIPDSYIRRRLNDGDLVKLDVKNTQEDTI